MRQKFAVSLASFLMLLIAACGNGSPNQSSNQSTTTSVKKMSKDVRIAASVTMTAGGRAQVVGTTNLPAGAQLMITMSNKVTGFTAQDTATVEKGHFRSVQLGRKSGLAAGNYDVDVSMSIASAQPKRVQESIGKHGQYLSGSFVKDSSFGGKWVDYSFLFAVGSKRAIHEAKLAHEKLVADIRSRIKELLNAGHEMEKYRNTDDLSALRICGIKMRKNQAIANKIRAKSEALSAKYFDLKVAASEVWSCVSCSDDAIKSCRQVAGSLVKNGNS